MNSSSIQLQFTVLLLFDEVILKFPSGIVENFKMFVYMTYYN